MLAVLKRMGREDLTVHGFLSSFRDWGADEVAPGLTTDSQRQKHAQTVVPTWTATGCVQSLGEEKRFRTTWTLTGPRSVRCRLPKRQPEPIR
jgi:hypothetical protein